jgi:GAF domain-containing protein
MAGVDAALEFDTCVDAALQMSCELARDLIAAHRVAMSLTFASDCAQARKFFSLTDDSQAELESHSPLRGLLAVPIVGEDGPSFGLLRASDKVDGTDFDEDEERRLQRLAALVALALDALVCVRKLRAGEKAPILQRARAPFVNTEPVEEAT